MKTNMNTNHSQPLCGEDLERWRVDNALTGAEAAAAFGLQRTKWEELTSKEKAADKISDPVIAMLLYLYRKNPESSPVKHPPDIKDFYTFLGMQDKKDLEAFAILIGRSPTTAYRLLLHDGKPGRPLMRWIEAVLRLNLTSKQSVRIMADVASSVGQLQQVGNVLVQGWSKQGGTSEHE